MSWEAVSALATLFTGVVILATVAVGLVQLSELRRATQLEGVVRVAEMFSTADFLEGLRFLRSDFERQFNEDPQFREDFFTPLKNSAASHREHQVLMVFELVGTYIKHGLVNGEAIFDIGSTRIVGAWRILGPAIAALREKRNDPLAWENAEILARDAAKWLERHTPKTTG